MSFQNTHVPLRMTKWRFPKSQFQFRHGLLPLLRCRGIVEEGSPSRRGKLGDLPILASTSQNHAIIDYAVENTGGAVDAEVFFKFDLRLVPVQRVRWTGLDAEFAFDAQAFGHVNL